MPDDDPLVGAEVVGVTGQALGSVRSLLIDPESHDARWLDIALPTGGHAVLPVQAASADGTGRLLIPYGEADLRSAPTIDGTVVSAESATALLEHYGFAPGAP